ncbi:MAG: HesA/MoeB/ThiF family protein [Oscillospiraceae bacterium]|nr:HesA/MoeB/ThiF family protein [Oscillospiraceae bacterium]
MFLSEKQQGMYSRQIIMKDIGIDGQKKLAEASVLVVGCGGLGAPVLYYLTAMGIGHLGLCDGDKVALSNLNRQILFTMDDIGKQKAKTASKQLKALNPDLRTTVYDMNIDEKSAEEIIPEYDIVVDCLDNFESRFILGDACIKAKKPLVHAGVSEYYGQLMTIIPGKSACLRCIFPKGIPTGDGSSVFPVPVIGPTPGVLGAMQAMEVAKNLLGQQVCSDGIVTFNGLELSLEKVKIEQNPSCGCCQGDGSPRQGDGSSVLEVLQGM